MRPLHQEHQVNAYDELMSVCLSDCPNVTTKTYQEVISGA